jgi:hypothetical protein
MSGRHDAFRSTRRLGNIANTVAPAVMVFSPRTFRIAKRWRGKAARHQIEHETASGKTLRCKAAAFSADGRKRD